MPSREESKRAANKKKYHNRGVDEAARFTQRQKEARMAKRRRFSVEKESGFDEVSEGVRASMKDGLDGTERREKAPTDTLTSSETDTLTCLKVDKLTGLNRKSGRGGRKNKGRKSEWVKAGNMERNLEFSRTDKRFWCRMRPLVKQYLDYHKRGDRRAELMEKRMTVLGKRKFYFCWNRWCRRWFRDRRRRFVMFVKESAEEKNLKRQRGSTGLLIDWQYRKSGVRCLASTGQLMLEQAFVKRIVEKLRDSDENVSEFDVERRVRMLLSWRGYVASRMTRSAQDLIDHADNILKKTEGMDKLSMVDLCGVGEHSRKRAAYFYQFAYGLVFGKREAEWSKLNEVSDDMRLTVMLRIAARRREEDKVRVSIFRPDFAIPMPLAYISQAKFHESQLDFWRSAPNWFCDKQCEFATGMENRLMEFLKQITNVNDLRQLFALENILECNHDKHVKKCTEKEIENILREEEDVIKKCEENCRGPTEIRYERMSFMLSRLVRLKKGNSLACLESDCPSLDLFLNKVTHHFPSLLHFLENWKLVREADGLLVKIDSALWLGDYSEIVSLLDSRCGYNVCRGLRLRSNLDGSKKEAKLARWKPGLTWQKSIRKKPEFICASCRLRCYRDEGKLYEAEMSRNEFIELKPKRKGLQSLKNQICSDIVAEAIISDTDLNQLFICRECDQYLKKGQSQCPKSIFNGLKVDQTPPELACLNSYERAFVCKARLFQSITHLATLGSKLPVSDLIKCHKGNVVYYPLPMEKTLSTIGENFRGYPSDDMYFLMYGVPTAKRIVWKSLIDFDKVNKAARWLKENNPEYADIELKIRSLEEFERVVSSNSESDESVQSSVEGIGG